MLEKNYLNSKTLIENGELKNMIWVMFGKGFILIKGIFDSHFPFMLQRMKQTVDRVGSWLDIF
jgi:hypothetical protein